MLGMFESRLLELKAEYNKKNDINEKHEFLVDTEVEFGDESKYTGEKIKPILQWVKGELKKIEFKSLSNNESETLKPPNNLNLSERKNKNPSDIYEQSIRIFKKATKEDAEHFNIEINDEYSIIPEPKDKEQLFERFEKLHAQRYFETIQSFFIHKYGEVNEKIIKDELEVLNGFIDKANHLLTTETFKNNWISPEKADFYEYSRLANGYYKNPNLQFYPYIHSYFNTNAVQVYAKYFLYKNWLEEKLNNLTYHIPSQQTQAIKKKSKEDFIETEASQKIIDALKTFGIEEYLTSKGYSVDKFNELIIDNNMPYRIALLSGIGFLIHFEKEFAKSKTEMFKKLSIVFNINERRIKGNINVLNEYSKEDKVQYTSHNFKEIATTDIMGLSKGL